MRLEVRSVFAAGRTQAMPLRVRQSVWQARTAGMPVGARTGGDGNCPVAAACDPTAAPVTETHAQLLALSPVARLVWAHVATAWEAFAAEPWTLTANAPGSPLDLAAQRAILLGVRPPTSSHQEPFGLLHGIAIHAIVAHRHSAWLLRRDDPAPERLDPIVAAASVYERVRVDFEQALHHDRLRVRLLTRQMRAAGLPLSSCEGPNSPEATWARTWGAVCTADDACVRQLVLPALPPAPVMTDAISLARLCPHPALAPPSALPPGCREAYAAPPAHAATECRGWGCVIVVGGNAATSQHAAHLWSAGGPLRLPGFGQIAVKQRSRAAAALTAIAIALEALAIHGTAPAVLRVASPQLAALVAGTWDPRGTRFSSADSPLLEHHLIAEVRRLWRRLRDATSGQAWIVAAVDTWTHVWAQRAAALAHYGHRGVWEVGPAALLPAHWASTPIAPPLVQDQTDCTDCPICMEDYTDLLPSQDATSRSMPGRWVCDRHCVCRACAEALVDPRCPICRQGRSQISLSFVAC